MSKIDSLVDEYGAKMIQEVFSKVGRSLDIDHAKKEQRTLMEAFCASLSTMGKQSRSIFCASN